MTKKPTKTGKQDKAIGHTDDCTFHNDRTRCTCGRLAADAKSKAGRDTKLTTQVQDAIVQSILNGATRTDASLAAGITYATFLNWLKRGDKFDKAKEEERDEDDEPFFEFFAAIKKAEAECANEMVAVVARAAKKQWQAAAWWLERRRREEYALRREITGADGEPFVPDHLAEAMKRAGKFSKPKGKK